MLEWMLQRRTRSLLFLPVPEMMPPVLWFRQRERENIKIPKEKRPGGEVMRKGLVDELQKIISESSNIVFFGGAGVSTESGIPDFRSVDGLYHQQWDYPPEVILSHSFFMKNPEEFYRFYRAKMLCEAKPNPAHK